MTKAKQNGLMVHIGMNPGLNAHKYMIYDLMLSIQKTMGCEYRKMKENDRYFDRYIGQTYIKGMTTLKTKNNIIIIGKDHHEKVSQTYFPNKIFIKLGFLGDTLSQGILLIDYQSDDGTLESGVATNNKEVKNTLDILIESGMPSNKQVYLTESTKIHETKLGKKLRKQGVLTIKDWLNYKFKEEKHERYLGFTGNVGYGGSLRTSSLW